MQPDANRIQHDIHDLRDQAATLDALAQPSPHRPNSATSHCSDQRNNHMQPDANRIQHDIHDLRDQAATLDALATRRIKIHHDTAHGHMSSAPTPLNLPAQDLLDQIHALTRRIALAGGLRFGRGMDVHALLKGLDRPEPCEMLAARGAAGAQQVA